MPANNPLDSKHRILFLRSWLEQQMNNEHVITTEEVVRLYSHYQ